MNKIKFLASAYLSAFLLTFVCIGLTAATGCTSTSLATKPVTTHVVHIAGSGKKLGIVEDPVTGLYSLGYQSIFVGVTTVPVSISQGSNGVISYIEPDAVASYEIAARPGVFGSAGSTYTVAVGSNAVQTLIGGQHPPINATYWTNTTTPATTTAPAATAITIAPKP